MHHWACSSLYTISFLMFPMRFPKFNLGSSYKVSAHCLRLSVLILFHLNYYLPSVSQSVTLAQDQHIRFTQCFSILRKNIYMTFSHIILSHSQSLQSNLAFPAILKDAWQLIKLFNQGGSTSRVSPGALKFFFKQSLLLDVFAIKAYTIH